jgi:hypothetical protein
MLCQLDKAKGLELGETYLNEKAALEFVKAIATADRNITRDMLQKAHCFCFNIVIPQGSIGFDYCMSIPKKNI